MTMVLTRSGGLGALRLISTRTTRTAIVDRIAVIIPIVERFLVKARTQAGALSSTLRREVIALEQNLDDLVMSSTRASVTPSTHAVEINTFSRNFNRTESRVNAAIAASASSPTPTPPISPIPTPTIDPEPRPRPAENVGRRTAEAIATGTARGIGQIVLVGALVVAGGLGLWWVTRQREAEFEN